MASWGRNVDVPLTGTGSIDEGTNTVIGVDTLFTDEVEAGDLIDLNGQGLFLVASVVDAETLTVKPTAGADAAGETIALSEAPKYLPTNALNEAVFVTVADAKTAGNRADGIKTPGWNLVKTIGNNRKSVETLVAMKQTSTL